LEAEDLGILSFISLKGKNVKPAIEHIMPNYSGDHVLVFDSGGKGEFSLGVPVHEKGKYVLTIYFVRAPDYGQVEVDVNGNPLGDVVDTFLKTDDLTRPIWPPKAFAYPEIALKEGMNEFRFTIDSKNPEAEGFKVGIDCLVLEKLR
jgi:hypothetical protein